MVGSARHDPLDPATLGLITEAIRGVDVSKTDAWAALDVLSSHTVVDAVEVIESVVKLVGESFEGVANVHCTLQYGEGKDHFTLSESFPGRFKGRMTGRKAVLDSLIVDTSGFLQ